MTGGAGDITNLWWQAVARHFGLDPEKDVELLFSGATTARMAALYAGAIEASVLSTPQSFKAIEDGFTDLGPVAPYLGEFPMMIWQVNARWAQGNEKLVLAFIRAHNQAVLYLTDPAHREEVAQMLASASRASLGDALKTWDVCMQVHAFVPDGSITQEAVARVRDTLIASGDLKPPPLPASAYYDARYVKAVAAEDGDGAVARATHAVYTARATWDPSGGGRRAKRAGWGSTATIARIEGPPPDRLSLCSGGRPPPCGGGISRVCRPAEGAISGR